MSLFANLFGFGCCGGGSGTGPTGYCGDCSVSSTTLTVSMYSELTASTLTATLTLSGGTYFGSGCFPSDLYSICFHFTFGCLGGLSLGFPGEGDEPLTDSFGGPTSSSVTCDPFALSYTFDPTSPSNVIEVTSVVISEP